jgi:hypothetical protein
MRMKQLGAQDRARADVISNELLTTLTRSPTAIDRVWAMTVAAATVKLENQLAMGRDTTTARRALMESIAASPFAPEQARQHA